MDNKNIDPKQSIYMYNDYSKTNNKYSNIIWNEIDNGLSDESLIKSINDKLFDTYSAKINIINNLLNSSNPLPILEKKDIIKFFNVLSPLNNEYNFASYTWNFKMYNGYLMIQNSICKADYCEYIKNKYINPIKNILEMTKFKFKYYEFKSNRFYKNIDIIFVIALEE